MHVYHMNAWYPPRADKGIKPPGFELKFQAIMNRHVHKGGVAYLLRESFLAHGNN